MGASNYDSLETVYVSTGIENSMNPDTNLFIAYGNSF